MSNDVQKSTDYMFDPVMFGKRVREARRQKGWNQEKLAEEISRSEGGYISDIERGRRRPSFETAVEIAEKLEVSLDYLCGRERYLKGRVVTMKDVAGALMVLLFFRGTSIHMEKREFRECKYLPDDVNFERPQVVVKEREIPIIEIREGVLRHFLPIYRKVFERPHTEDFCEIIERQLDKLNKISVWDEYDDSAWKEFLSLCDAQGYPREEAERIIWNSTPPPTK